MDMNNLILKLTGDIFYITLLFIINNSMGDHFNYQSIIRQI